MKIYKFRPLANEHDFCRARQILETGYFWCTTFWELNDPMEGVFYSKVNLIDEIYNEKKEYKICSFSGEKAFENPALWGYYANGFRGIAIEIEIDRDKVEPIIYNDDIPSAESCDKEIILKILTSKFKTWHHEYEYRFLTNDSDNFHKIGNITAVYFGNPYGDTAHSNVIQKNKNLNTYNTLKKRLTTIAEDMKINCKNISIVGIKVKK